MDRTWIIGLVLAIVGCFISNLGLALQKLVHLQNSQMGDVHVNYTKSWVWRGGLLLIIVGSLADLGALAFAPQSLVAPLGSLTLVSNIIYAPLILKETIDPLSIGSTLVIVIGSAFAVAYAPHEEVAYTTPDLFGLFFSLGFVLFCLCLLLLLGGLLGLARHCEMVESAHGRGSTAYISLRSLHQFTYPAASGIVGAQSVLFAKCASRLAANSSEDSMLKYPGSYVVVVMLFVCIFSQIKLLNDGLKRFDAVYEVPVFQAFWILVSVLSGMALYKEYTVMSPTDMGLFSFGVLITLTGVIALSRRKPPSQTQSSSRVRSSSVSEALEMGVTASQPWFSGNTARSQGPSSTQPSGSLSPSLSTTTPRLRGNSKGSRSGSRGSRDEPELNMDLDAFDAALPSDDDLLDSHPAIHMDSLSFSSGMHLYAAARAGTGTATNGLNTSAGGLTPFVGARKGRGRVLSPPPDADEGLEGGEVGDNEATSPRTSTNISSHNGTKNGTSNPASAKSGRARILSANQHRSDDPVHPKSSRPQSNDELLDDLSDVSTPSVNFRPTQASYFARLDLDTEARGSTNHVSNKELRTSQNGTRSTLGLLGSTKAGRAEKKDTEREKKREKDREDRGRDGRPIRGQDDDDSAVDHLLTK